MAAVGVVATACAAATACSAPLVVEPADFAADPRCASMMLAVPHEVGGLRMRSTSSQATTAYGDDPSLIVRCGVAPPGPSEDRCIAVETPTSSQDWLISETDEAWLAVSFGRSPALEVTIPKVRADQAVAELLSSFNGPASLADPNDLQCR